MEPTIYAMYQGDKLLMVGTKYLLAQHFGVEPQTIEGYATPSAQKLAESNPKRRYAVRVVDGEAKPITPKGVQEVCTAILRKTRGACMNGRDGCGGIGWCKTAYETAVKMKYLHMKEKGTKHGKQKP